MDTKRMSYILNIVLLIILLIGSTFFITKLKIQSSDYDSIVNYMENEKNQIMNSNDLVVQEMKTINQNLVSSDEKIKELSSELSEYKKINSYTKAELLTEIRGINVEYTLPEPSTEYVYVPDTNCVPIDTLNKYYTQVPKKVSYNDEWMSFNGTVGLSKFSIDSLSLLNKFDITIGERVVGKKLLVFNKREAVVDLKSYNPYTGIPFLNNITVEPKKSKLLPKALSYAGIFFAGMIVQQLK